MWPKSTSTDDVLYGGPADLRSSASTSTASLGLDEFEGPQTNDSSKKDFSRQKRAAKQKSADTPTSVKTTPPPNRNPGNNPSRTPPPFKRPNDSLQFGDRIDIARFTKQLSEHGQPKTLQDPDTGYRIQRDMGGHGPKGQPRFWKLRDGLNNPVGSLDETGKFLAKMKGR
jgi:hypothetical protein